ncbi:FAD-binding protein [Sphaerochaeta halotolerans]|uniref:FAD-dependent oxidoreductase n=1 Tax=Sphaerochaeta halotolerans TaxID=2293840 RepID=UPI00136A9ACC|nr:FAD-binding protein [Sphaerochaeta halotolerans]MXI86105.1 FAD-binding protein [Sphaerochaeta halotolerans]
MVDAIEQYIFQGLSLPVHQTGVLIIGSGTASLSCAIHLHRMGCTDMLIVTDNRNGGTSRNAGSDKQTYYRQSDASHVPDSPYAMVESYTRGGATHGDIAFIEAQNSLRAFYNLVSLGMDFPYNRYGGYTGYKTDHDPSSRGISMGPYTSREMVRVLSAEVKRNGTPFWDQCDVVRLLTDEQNQMVGAVILDKTQFNTKNHGLSIVLSDHVVLGTGGPAGFYASSVYPRVHMGSIGLAMEIGAEAANLTESQFGIASIKFRWNLSGSYQQVLPRYYSTDQEGNYPEDFLSPYFSSWEALTNAVFFKGYQWPFDAAKIPNEGSSLIDLLVYEETQVKGRRVFMDFRENLTGKPVWTPFSKSCVGSSALGYLQTSGAWAKTPYERLQLLNQAAIDMYASNHIDLSKEPLEIDVCAQHNNGGLSADIWWESTNIAHLYPIGEVNGSHGVSRPGGSALNSGQVGALRAAARIMGYGIPRTAAIHTCKSQINDLLQQVRNVTSGEPNTLQEAKVLLDTQLSVLQHRMSRSAGPIRVLSLVDKAFEEAKQQQASLATLTGIPSVYLPKVLRLRHMVVAQTWYLYAIKTYLERGGGSRGSYLVVSEEGQAPHPLLATYSMVPEERALRSFVQVVGLIDSHALQCRWDACREVPSETFWFERVWQEFKEKAYFNV